MCCNKECTKINNKNNTKYYYINNKKRQNLKKICKICNKEFITNLKWQVGCNKICSKINNTQKKCWYYTNFQPLLEKDNIIKGNKILGEQLV